MKDKALVFLLLIFSIKVLCFPSKLTGKDDTETSEWIQQNQEGVTRQGDKISVNSTLYKTMKRYQCYIESVKDAELLLYGFQLWTFPEQDVQLTLSYPAENMDAEYEERFRDHLVTGVEVVLWTSGEQSQAFIGTGGLLERNVSVTFISEDTSLLAYQFWVYGLHQDQLDVDLTRSQGNVMC